jgi:hypothetical protein
MAALRFGIFDHVDDSGLLLAEHYATRLRLVEARGNVASAGCDVHDRDLSRSVLPGRLRPARCDRPLDEFRR